LSKARNSARGEPATSPGRRRRRARERACRCSACPVSRTACLLRACRRLFVAAGGAYPLVVAAMAVIMAPCGASLADNSLRAAAGAPAAAPWLWALAAGAPLPKLPYGELTELQHQFCGPGKGSGCPPHAGGGKIRGWTAADAPLVGATHPPHRTFAPPRRAGRTLTHR
jgi:hypothetical protein